jgi:hypothetical protein
METYPVSSLNIFKNPARILISGFSGSGKTELTKRLINKYINLFDTIIIIGADFNLNHPKIIRRDDYDPFQNIDEHRQSKSLLIFDDIILEQDKLKLAAKIFVKGRHLNLSAIFLSQNLFFSDKNFRILSLNCTHVILLRNRDLKQIKYFASTFVPGNINKFIDLYKSIVLKKPFGYIVTDFTVDIDSKLAFRTNCFNEAKYESLFKL